MTQVTQAGGWPLRPGGGKLAAKSWGRSAKGEGVGPAAGRSQQRRGCKNCEIFY